jgi:hypothetical protein
VRSKSVSGLVLSKKIKQLQSSNIIHLKEDRNSSIKNDKIIENGGTHHGITQINNANIALVNKSQITSNDNNIENNHINNKFCSTIKMIDNSKELISNNINNSASILVSHNNEENNFLKKSILNKSTKHKLQEKTDKSPIKSKDSRKLHRKSGPELFYKNALQENDQIFSVQHSKIDEPNSFFQDPIDFFKKSSLFIFHIKWGFRRKIISLVNNRYFDYVMIVLIIMSCIITFMDSPFEEPNSTYDRAVNILDYIFTWIFFAEMVLKIIAFGFYFDYVKTIEIIDEEKGVKKKIHVEKDFTLFHYDYIYSKEDNIEKYTKKPKNKNKGVVNEYGLTALVYDFIEIKNEEEEERLDILIMKRAYFRNIWNIIDFIIVNSSLIYFFNNIFVGSSINSLKTIKVFRSIRSIRPLRMVTRMRELRSIVNCLFLTVPAMGNLLIITLCFYLVFGILGVNLYKGVLGNCSNPIYKSYSSCVENQFTWASLDNNFDNILYSFLVLFQLSMSQSWKEIMFDTVDYSNNWTIIYFVIYMIIGNIFLINLSISIIVGNFFNLKEYEEGLKHLTKDQRDWIKIIRHFLKFKPKFSITNNFSKARRRFVLLFDNSLVFKSISHFFILGNIIIMALKNSSSGETYFQIYENFFYISTIFFNFEILVKYLMKREYFLLNYWHKIDMFLLILTDFLLIVKFVLWVSGNPYFYITIFLGIMRILRIFHILRIFNVLRDYLDSILIIIPSLVHISSLLVLILLIYSSLGISIFGTVKFGDYINENANFRSFSKSFLTLVRCLTGEDWNSMMIELTKSLEGCKNDQTFQELIQEPLGCGTYLSYPFFISFILISYLIVLNLFVAVVVDTFIAVTDKELLVDQKFTHEFFGLWGKYDVEAKFLISPISFALFLKELTWPLGLRKENRLKNYKAYSKNSINISHDGKYFTDNRDSLKILSKVDIYSRNGMVHILDAIKLVTKRYITKTRKITEEKIVIKNKNINNYLLSKFYSYDYNFKNYITTTKPYTAAHSLAVTILSKLINDWKEGKKKIVKRDTSRSNRMAERLVSFVSKFKKQKTIEADKNMNVFQ